MNLRAYVTLSVAAFLLFIAGCQQNPTEPTATKTSSISGVVLDAQNSPLALARVIDIGSLAPVDTSRSDGSYRLNLEISDNYTTSLYAILTGYKSDTQKVTLKPGDNLTAINFHMQVSDSSKIVVGNSGRPASIGLVSQTAKSIMLKGGLIDQSSTLTFLVVDSLNRPVTGVNKCKVKFSISVSSPSGESLKPDTAQTDPLTGLVSTTVFSGTKPNAILVTAQVIDPVRRITANAGLTEGTRMPDGNHVSISASKFNIAGRVFDGLSSAITMTVNDQFGNPVADGTPVSFVTNGGGITKDAFTINGAATATLSSGGGNPPIGGWVTVTAEVKGDTSVRKADSSIVRTIQILFSGHSTLTRASNATNFEVPDGDMNYFDYTVADDYGNPLVEGSSIQVSVDAFNEKLLGSVALKGDINVIIPNTTDVGWTHFRVWVVDKNLDSLSGTILLKITVKSQNDGLVYQFSGFMRGITAGAGGFGVPASIVCTDTVQTALNLKETGTNTQKRLTFKVKDLNGNPVSKAVVNFTLSESPIGTTLSKAKDSSNASGEVMVDVLSGYKQGVARVLAAAGSVFGYSLPIEISRGLPDSNSIFLVLNKKNMFNKSDVVGKVSVTLMDRYGYPAVSQIIRGTTTGGWVGLVPATIDGKTSFDLNGGSIPNDPIRGPGFGYVSVIVPAYYADVVGSVSVKKSIPFLFSGAPAAITFDPAKVTGNTLNAPLVQNGSVTVTYTIADANNRPLSSGNKYTVTASGTASNELQLSGDINVVQADDTTLTAYSVTVTDKGGSGGPFTLTFTSTGESGTLTKSITGTVSTASSGYASSIQLVAVTPSTISVKATGETETSMITFQVKDSVGNPISASRADSIHFSFAGGGIGGGEFLIPPVVLTDANGKATTTVNAGTVSGVLQVVASIGAIRSAPVQLVIQSGLADPGHVTAGFLPDYSSSLNYDTTTIKKGSIIGLVGVILGDKYSNPARPSAVYFTSYGNLILPSAITNAGIASVSILRADPLYVRDTITITTKGQGGQDITRKIFLTAVGSQTSAITPPTQIILSTLSSSIIAASGTGGLNTSDVSFQALDAGGRAIGTAQSDTMFFSLSDTSGGAHLIPTWAMTNATGQASTKLYGGIRYGSPTITARMKTVLSQPVPIRISGPSWTNFNVTISANNLPGLSQLGTIVGKLNAQIGDTLGNPVLAGTIIKFVTSGGMVDASAVTDASGSANANLSGGATPNEPSLGGIGWGYVTAQTQGNNGTSLQKKIPFLFSGVPIISTLNVPPNDTIILLDAGYADIDYRIADGNGNPLAAGNAVRVTVTGADAAEISLGNAFSFSTDGNPTGQTVSRVRIADRLPSAGTGGNFDIIITVNGPNGDNIVRQFHGFLRAPGAINPPSPSALLPAQITFVSVSTPDIYVSGTGSTENSVITYEVRDSLGQLISTKSPRPVAQFTMQFYPNTFTNVGTIPRLIPSADSTDDNARLHVSVASGTQAGVIQVYTRIDLGGGNFVISQPVKISVHAGFADQRHFTLSPTNYNFPGLERAFLPEQMTVQVVDQYSNPVLLGTSVYFNTIHGSVGTGKSGAGTGITDVDGFVKQTLWASNPYPEFADTINLGPGYSYVYARTLGESSVWVKDSVLMLWTGKPIITADPTNPATYAIPNGGSAGPWRFTVADKYGHPMSAGTTITVTGAGLAIDGDGANVIMPDTFASGPGTTTFSIVISDLDPVVLSVPPTKSLLTVTVNHPVYGRYQLVLAGGTVQ